MHLGMSRSQAVTFSLMVACIVLLPLVLYPVFLMKVMCYALFACAFNLVLGYAGLLPFGHAAFFGTGAYIGAWTAKALMLTPELAILCGGAAGGILGVAFGFLAIRRQGLDFAMITLALAQMTYFFYLQAPFTNGEDGIQKVPRGDAFGLVSLEPDMTMYWFVSAIFLGGFAFIYRVVHSPFGNVLKGIRENSSAPRRLATAPTTTSSSRSGCPPSWPRSRAPPRRMSSASPRFPTSASRHRRLSFSWPCWAAREPYSDLSSAPCWW